MPDSAAKDPTLEDLANVALEAGRVVGEASVKWWWKLAYQAIATRAAELGQDMSTLDSETLRLVLTLATASRARVGGNAGVKRIDVQVDDGRVSKEITSGSDAVVIRDDWWVMLGIADDPSIFTIRPHFEPDGHTDWSWA